MKFSLVERSSEERRESRWRVGGESEVQLVFVVIGTRVKESGMWCESVECMCSSPERGPV